MARIDLRGDALPEGPALRDLLPRADFDVSAALEKVRPICEAVHHRIKAMIRSLDAATLRSRMDQLLARPPKDLRKALSDWARRHSVVIG